MVNKDELYAEILRLQLENRELKEHLAMVYVDLANAEWRFEPVQMDSENRAIMSLDSLTDRN